MRQATVLLISVAATTLHRPSNLPSHLCDFILLVPNVIRPQKFLTFNRAAQLFEKGSFISNSPASISGALARQ
jgi:hypothetical protein